MKLNDKIRIMFKIDWNFFHSICQYGIRILSVKEYCE